MNDNSIKLDAIPSNQALQEAETPSPNNTLPPYRNWKVKQYTVPLETRMAQERATRAQPPLISLHGKGST